MTEYAEGGYVGPGSPGLAVIHPDECFINREGRCTRPGHPTPTSDGNGPDAFWICEERDA